MSTRLVACSATGAPTPTPALLTSTSRRPKRSRWRATTLWISSSTSCWPRPPRPRSPRPAAPARRRRASRAAARRPSAVALLAEHVRDREPDAARGSGDEGCAVGHGAGTYTLSGDEHALSRVALVLLVLLLGAGFAFDDGDDGAARSRLPAGRGGAAAPVATIAARVERIRGLRFETRPRPVEVEPGAGPPRRARGPRPLLPRGAAPRRRGGAQAARPARAVGRPAQGVGRPCSARASRATTTRARSACGSSRAPRPPTASSRRSRSPTSSRTRSRTSASGSTSRTPRGSDDAALARLALVEGSATAVMFTLRASATSPPSSRSAGLLASLGAGHRRPAAVPGGAAAVPLPGRPGVRRSGCYATGDDSWTVRRRRRALPPARLDRADPASREVPRGRAAAARARLGVRARAGGRAGGALAAGTWGEWATGELLGAAPAAAEGWGGDRYELWQQPTGTCQAPCRQRDALVMRWRWDTRARRARVRRRAARVAAAAAGAERGARARPRRHARPRPRRRARTPPGAGLACARGR